MTKFTSVAGILLFAACISAQSISWDDLRVTFSFTGQLDGYFKLPRTKVEADAEGWTSAPEVVNAQYDILCPEQDPSVCVIYSKATGDVNGIEIGMLVADTAGPYDYELHPSFVRQTRFGYDVYVTSIYTVKPGSVTATTPRQGEKLETGEGAWLEVGPKGVPFFEIPRFEADMGSTLFTLQNCITNMGFHYYYNVSANLPCEEFEPMFALYKEGEMIGFGIQTWGSPTHLSRHWFEPVPYLAIRPTVPDAPQCLVDWTREFKLISLHVYFVDAPWTITCP